MTPEQIATAKALGNCSFPPGTADKRFARNMAFLAEHSPEREITERKDLNLRRLAYRYRRQMPAALVPAEKPADLPPKPPKARPDRTQTAATTDQEPRVPCLFDGAWASSD